MANSSRERILSRLRGAEKVGLPKPLPMWFPEAAKGERSQADVIDEFVQRMEATWSTVIRCSMQDVVPTLRQFLRDNDLGNIVQAPTTWIGTKIAGEWTGDDPKLLDWDPADSVVRDEIRDKLFASTQASITTVKAGIADEAAVVLWPDAVEPRLLSLVPPVYIAAVRTSEILPSFSAAVAAFKWAESRPRNAVLISGPSKSADIENTLRVGIHGPVKLVVLVVDDAEEVE